VGRESKRFEAVGKGKERGGSFRAKKAFCQKGVKKVLGGKVSGQKGEKNLNRGIFL